LLASLAVSSPAFAQFGPTLDLSTPGELASNPDVGVDASGTSTVVWDQRISGAFVVQARRITAAGVLGPTVDLSLPSSIEALPRVVVDGAGDATVVWKRTTAGPSGVIQARRLAADGTRGPVIDVSAPVPGFFGIGGPDAALASGSAVVVAWIASENGPPATIKVLARRIAPAGTLGPVLEPFVGGPPPEFTPFALGIGSDAAGNVTVVWSRANDNLSGNVFAEARRVAADDSLGVVHGIFTFLKGPTGGSRTGISVEPGGLATFVGRSDSGPGGSALLLARRLAADGTLGPLHTPGGPTQCAIASGSGESVAGRATVVWGCLERPFSGPSVKAQQIGADEVEGPVLDIAPQGAGVVFDPTTAVVRDVRRVSAFWLISDPAEGRVQARRIVVSGRLGQTIDAAVVSPGSLHGPRLAADPTGLTTVVWSHDRSGGATLIQAAQGWVSIYADVPHGHPFWPWIDALSEAGITGGCVDDPAAYCPDDPVTRAQMAVFLERGRQVFDPPAATGTVFDDVPASDPFARWIEPLFHDGITGGCSTTPPLYCPSDLVTRGQIAVFLLRARHGAGFVPPPGTGTVFADVPASHPFVSWIEQLALEGITGGCGGGNYCPDATVTRGQMAVFLVRAFSLPR
jgi:hypothetical protein